MMEDSQAQLVNADYLRVFLSQYQSMQPYIQRFSGKDEGGESSSPKDSKDRDGEGGGGAGEGDKKKPPKE